MNRFCLEQAAFDVQFYGNTTAVANPENVLNLLRTCIRIE